MSKTSSNEYPERDFLYIKTDSKPHQQSDSKPHQQSDSKPHQHYLIQYAIYISIYTYIITHSYMVVS